MEKKETAEQKLLKIIENTSGAGAAQGKESPTPKAVEDVAKSIKSIGLGVSLPPFLSPLLEIFKGKSSSVGPSVMAFGLREVNKILLISVFVMIALLSFNLTSGMKTLKLKEDFALDNAAAKGIASSLAMPRQAAEYLINIRKRNIFQPFEKKESEAEIVETTGARRIGALTKNLKLVGISWLESPDTASAMIEDTQSGITHFLRVGDKINEVTVKTIYADRVILTYEDEEVAVRL